MSHRRIQGEPVAHAKLQGSPDFVFCVPIELGVSKSFGIVAGKLAVSR